MKNLIHLCGALMLLFVGCGVSIFLIIADDGSSASRSMPERIMFLDSPEKIIVTDPAETAEIIQTKNTNSYS